MCLDVCDGACFGYLLVVLVCECGYVGWVLFLVWVCCRDAGFVVLSVVLVAIVVFLYDCFGFIVIDCCLCGVAPNGFCGLIRFCCFGLG